MKIRVVRDMRDGSFHIRFLLEEFSEEEIFLLARYGPMLVRLPVANFDGPNSGRGYGNLELKLEEIPTTRFWFSDGLQAQSFGDEVVNRIKTNLEKFVGLATEFVGETVFEIKAGEEIKRISEGARKVLDRNSLEYKEVIEKNREAFEKLSKL